jgi:hypothetical protein
MVNNQSSLVTKSIDKKPKVKLQYPEINQRKGKKPASAPPRQALPTPVLSSPAVSLEPIKSLPLTIFDFNGEEGYYEHMSPFIDTNSLHLICVHTADFHQATPMDIEEVFRNTFDISSYPMIRQLFQILQLLCEKVTEKNSVMILPIATCIDLYDKRSTSDK